MQIEEMKIVEPETKKEVNDENEKVQKIVKKAKEKGQITYGELAKELEDTNPEQIDKVFDAFEEMGVDLLGDSFDDAEPDIEDLEEVEDIKLEDITNLEKAVDDILQKYEKERLESRKKEVLRLLEIEQDGEKKKQLGKELSNLIIGLGKII